MVVVAIKTHKKEDLQGLDQAKIQNFNSHYQKVYSIQAWSILLIFIKMWVSQIFKNPAQIFKNPSSS